MRKIFVSGCYDIIHAGHIQFFREARELGDFLTVSFASKEVLWFHKERKSSLPDEHKQALLNGLTVVDEVVVGEGLDEGIDFREHFLRIRPDVLAVTEDDKYSPLKRALCEEVGAEYVVLPKTPPEFAPISTTDIVRYIRAPQVAPLRVDFGGGWLDVPKFALEGGYVVNCAISPTVSLQDWPYERNAGLGGSGAWALINGKNGVEAELDLGVGWQDPAVISETGLCVWRSGPKPELEIKHNADFLRGMIALYWTGKQHDTPGTVENARDFDAIETAGKTARDAVWASSLEGLAEAVKQSYAVQVAEGMDKLPGEGESESVIPVEFLKSILAKKYCGGGFGGYALYLCADEETRDGLCEIEGFRAVEPYVLSGV
ncbi:MAG: cytidyltransferase [Opitutaceae bacterium]|nr:cytidyltransferase [Opitutaceae bacterium]|tara:strand:- start:1417 stop:2538 length:1122 start_codon:yes stop_codon:yes gene_type:complete